ncbi:MAG: GAF domain-containing protein [Myxococcaceae bacterium]|nr:GAF domain-containing protein [Myxococcaceae bacterium]
MPSVSTTSVEDSARRNLLRYQSVLLQLGAEQDTDFGTFLNRLLKSDSAILGVDRVSFWTFEPDLSVIRCTTLYCAHEDRFSGGEEFSEPETPRYFRALREDLVISADDALRDERTAEFADTYLAEHGISSMLDVPVWRDGRLSGVLCHEHVGPQRIWQPEEQTFALAVGQFISMGLERDERRKTEEALNESEARFAALVESAKDLSLLLLDPDGRVRTGTHRVHGFPVQELAGQPLSSLFTPQDIEEGRLERALEVACREGKFESEGWLLRKDGSRYWGRIVLMPLYRQDGTLRGFVTITRDLTEQRLARDKERLLEETRRSEERQRLLADVSAIVNASLSAQRIIRPAAHVMVNNFAQGCVLTAPRPLRSSGRAPTERRVVAARGERLREELERLSEVFSQRGNWGAWVPEVSRRGRSLLIPKLGDTEINRLAGAEPARALLRELGPGSLLVVPLSARRRVLGSLVLFRGPGETPFGAADLQLAEEVGRRIAFAADNARLYDLARESIRVRDQFLSIAAHEFRTPLTTLKLQLQLVERTLRAVPEAAVPMSERRHVALALRQVTRLGGLVQELLDVSRVSAGMLDLRRDSIDLSALVREVAEIFESEAARAGSTISLSIDENVIGQWDRGRLEQVLTNLLSNALRYGAGKPVEILLRGGPEEVFLIVRDRGIGIAPEDQQRIFGRFERAASARHFGGLGLGLFITRRIVEAHRGTIEVSSQPGEGSTFVVRLPRWAATAGSRERVALGTETTQPAPH